MFDTSKPSPARIYDYLLGGTNNFAVDREAGDAIRQALPHIPGQVRANRRFLLWSTSFCVRHGISQFVDIGTGIPLSPTVYEVARSHGVDARVVGVDNDPLVVLHDQAAHDGRASARILRGDVRCPRAIMGNAALREVIDLDRPIALLLAAVLHFITDADEPHRLVQAFLEMLAPGSFVVLSHATSTGSDPEVLDRVRAVYSSATSPVIFRSEREIGELLGDLTLLTPGLVDVEDWPTRRGHKGALRVIGGLARKDQEDNPVASPE